MTNEEAAIYLEMALPLRGPHGTVTDGNGAVYVADTGGGVVRKFVPVTQ